jgi:hypothetical protein
MKVIYNQKGLDNYQHASVCHSVKEWVRNDVHTNHVETFGVLCVGGVYGINQISYKHLQRYCDEFTYRYNSRKIKDSEGFTQSLLNMERRLD